jgi:hypothetical protein
MRGAFRGPFVLLFLLVPASAFPIHAQQAPDTFHWIDFHSPKDQDVVVWVTRSLEAENWTAIREIGVEWDAALVVTTQRATPQSSPQLDTFAVYSVSLTNHSVTALLKGANLRLLDWMQFATGRPREIAALYSNCSNCNATTFLTAFYYDIRQHGWAARWMHGAEAIRIGSQNVTEGVTVSQVYAVLADPNGHEIVATWNHFDYGKEKPVEDYLYQYDVDPWTGLDRNQLISGKDAEAMKRRLCLATDAVSGLEAGQDSELCQPFTNAATPLSPKTTPPPNAHGRSEPPGYHHKQ